MGRKPKDIATEALQLDPRSRASLAKKLLDSLEGLSDEKNERLWAEEAARRYSEFKKATSKLFKARRFSLARERATGEALPLSRRSRRRVS